MTRMPDNYYRSLEMQIEGILGDLDRLLSGSEVNEVRQFIEVGEYGLALETLGGIIFEEDYTIPRPVFKKMIDMSQRMEIDSKLFDKIKVEGDS